MPHPRFSHIVAVLALGLLPVLGHAASVKTDYVEAELVSEQLALVAGQPARIALRLKHDKDWHTYWRNPGDSGLPTKIEWQLPTGFAVGPIEWPVPKRIPIPPLANYGYEGEILLISELQVPASLFPGNVRIRARADWLVCKTVCLPGGADLELELPVVQGSPAPNDRWAKLFAATLATLPTEVSGWRVTGEAKSGTIDLVLKPGGESPTLPKSVYFFSAIEGLVEPARVQQARIEDGLLKVSLPVAVQLAATDRRIEGILVAEPPLAGNASAVNIRGPINGTIVAGTPDPPRGHAAKGTGVAPEQWGGGATGNLGLLAAIFFALVGGAILNLMPCVFPVLSIKILGFADQAHGDRQMMRGHGLAFGVGVVASFLVLAGALIALRASGEALGWGFQLQSPIVVTVLALVFFALGLNLSGVFEILVPLPDAPTRPPRHPLAGSFGTGVLAAVVASPCTAPFMGAALGYAVTQNAVTALAVFAALGVGMALPYVLLAWFPGWLKKLPRPGPWLIRLKQFLAFPLYATVAWLGWVLSLQVGADGILWMGLGLVMVGLAAWLWGTAQRGAGGVYRLGAALALLAAIGLGLPPMHSAATANDASAAAEAEWEPYSRERLAQLAAAAKPVFVDFTAAWCVTCQVNKKLVLDSDSGRKLFAEKSVTLMRADWTRRDPEITQALAKLGRNSVPVYVLYRPGKAPLILPELLQESILREALATL